VVEHRLQTNRFELKYVIEEPHARAIRDYLQGFLEPDEHVQDPQTCSYAIHSLYLDTSTLLLCRQSTQGLKNRFKMRIRFYDDAPSHPAFLEIKRRLTNAIRKERAAVRREGVRRLLNGQRLVASDLLASNGARGEDAAERFCGLLEELALQPAAYVSYVREAYVSPDSDQLRVTFDRRIRGALFDEQSGLRPPTNGIAAKVRGVVLELKFVDRFPVWMRDMVWAFDLARCSMAKYVHCVDALGIRPGQWLDAEPHGPRDAALFAENVRQEFGQ